MSDIKYIEYEGRLEPSTIKEHLKDGKPDPIAQLEYCEEVGCPDCYYCVWASYMIPYIKTSTKKAIKQKINKTEQSPTKFDSLAKNITNKPIKKGQHPLYHLLLELFTTNGENK